jgi:hypothetical protein
MKINFQTVDWDLIESTRHACEQGIAFWKTSQVEGLRFSQKIGYSVV